MKGTAPAEKPEKGDPAGVSIAGRNNGVATWARGTLLGTLAVLAIIWIPFSLLPAELGWSFGTPFKLFYSAIGITGGLFFALLKVGPSQGAGPPVRVVGGITLTYLLTVGALVGVGLAFPQFEIRPSGEETEEASGAERGKALFQDSGIGCYLCHTVTGAGGLRGPDLAKVGETAATRKAGLSADEYLRESITNPTAYLVANYPPIMPPNYGDRLSVDQIDDLMDYLKSLR